MMDGVLEVLSYHFISFFSLLFVLRGVPFLGLFCDDRVVLFSFFRFLIAFLGAFAC